MKDMLRIAIDEHVEDSQRRVSRNPDHFVGPEPWQLRPGEAAELQIDLARYPRMLWTWYYFQMFLGLIHPNDFNETEDSFDDERKARKDIFEQGMTPRAFTAFATQYAALTAHEAQAIYAKMNPAPMDATGRAGTG